MLCSWVPGSSEHKDRPHAMQAMVGKLKAKRFRQIFDYLDTAGGGDLDMVTLVCILDYFW